MKIIAIIAEFNPFHKGHKALINKIRAIEKNSVIAVIMSGDFHQRGIPAIEDKWKRAEVALREGCDLVIELPVIYSLSSAREFASGGVMMANSIPCDMLAFGSELGDIEALKKASDFSLKYREDDKIFLEGKKRGSSYSKTLLSLIFEELNINLGSNDILGLEYLRAIKKNNYNITPLAIKREEGEGYLSAKKIREELRKTSLNQYVFFEDFQAEIFYLITIKTKSELLKIEGASEEFVNLIIKARRKETSLSGIIGSILNKNYSHSRIRRYLLNLLIDIKAKDKKDIKKEEPLRVLGANQRGLSILRDNKILKFKNHNSKTLDINRKASNIYHLKTDGKFNTDYSHPPIIIK